MAVNDKTGKPAKKTAAGTAKKKTGKATTKANPTVQDEKTTRELILMKSLELINTRGMVDFRTDTLAQSLGLSPGNITYHFSRKEDICVALWEAYLEEYKQVVRSLTTLLDLKQLYLIHRINIELNYKYRGVVVFRSSDLGAIKRDQEQGRENETGHLKISDKIVSLLEGNGYLDDKADPNIRRAIHTYNYIIMRWCINFAYEAYKPEEVKEQLDYLSLLSVHAFYPLLSKKGIEEFEYIMHTVISGNLLSKDKEAPAKTPKKK